MADYRVNLEIFTGPLDLLLYLVRKEEVDIYDIPLAEITDQYIRYIEMLKNLDIDLAGDFLVMASTLLQIKSAMLLPKSPTDELQTEDINDPRTELIRQLLEYKKFKDAANMLNAVADEHKERFARPKSVVEYLKTISNETGEQPVGQPDIDLESVSIWDLLEAFDTISKAIGNTGYTGQITDDTPIDVYQIEILHRLQNDGPLTFERIFESATKKAVMVGLFLALLELIRSKLIWAEQPVPSTIYVRALTEEEPEQAVHKAIIDLESTQQKELPPAAHTPPIPIVELPPQDKKISDEEEILEDNEEQRQELNHN